MNSTKKLSPRLAESGDELIEIDKSLGAGLCAGVGLGVTLGVVVGDGLGEGVEVSDGEGGGSLI